MIEVALVFDPNGKPIYWHLPPGGSSCSIPDSQTLWDVLWEHKDWLGGVAHTHPFRGLPLPSYTDVTTFAACESGLGARLLWPIVTINHVRSFVWEGHGRYDYKGLDFCPLGVDEISKLRKLSQQEG